MVRILLRVAIAGALLCVLVQFYIDYRHTTYTVNHGANAFDVALWRLTDPGGYLTSWILPDSYFSLCCDDPEIVARGVWLVPTMILTFNALIWSPVASGVAYMILRTRKPRPVPTI